MGLFLDRAQANHTLHGSQGKPMTHHRQHTNLFSKRAGKSAALILAVVVVVVVILLAAMAYMFMGSAGPAPLPVPTPNAYDEMTKLGAGVVGALDVTGADEAALEKFLADNSAILNALDTAIQYDSVVPTDHDTASPSIDVAATRDAHRLRHAEAELATMHDNPVVAVNSFLKLIVAARKLQLGGFSVHKLMASGFERMAWTRIGELADQLSSQEKAALLKELNSLPPKNLGNYQDREKAAGVKAVGRVRAFLMRRHTQETFDRVEEVLAEVEAIEHATMEKLER
ncbi:MAG: hypothetical protein KDB27_34115 [Planctomycetales bacterium]|nr:hypothetical protein [Planctomycetales bacterium]